MTEQEKFFKTMNRIVSVCFKLFIFFIALGFILGVMGVMK